MRIALIACAAAIAGILPTLAQETAQPAPQVPAERPAVLAACQPGVSFVNITEGRSNPPIEVIPDVESHLPDGSIRNEWTSLNSDPRALPLRAVCSYGGDTTLTATATQEVAIPREAKLCILHRNTFACFAKRP